VADNYDIAVDFMDMTDDRHLWVRAADVRRGLALEVGAHAVVGDEDADPRVVSVDERGNLELEILPGAVEAHLDLLARA
jgi:hypothetical protein